jgi:hypothetical protein
MVRRSGRRSGAGAPSCGWVSPSARLDRVGQGSYSVAETSGGLGAGWAQLLALLAVGAGVVAGGCLLVAARLLARTTPARWLGLTGVVLAFSRLRSTPRWGFLGAHRRIGAPSTPVTTRSAVLWCRSLRSGVRSNVATGALGSVAEAPKHLLRSQEADERDGFQEHRRPRMCVGVALADDQPGSRVLPIEHEAPQLKS